MRYNINGMVTFESFPASQLTEQRAYQDDEDGRDPHASAAVELIAGFTGGGSL